MSKTKLKDEEILKFLETEGTNSLIEINGVPLIFHSRKFRTKEDTDLQHIMLVSDIRNAGDTFTREINDFIHRRILMSAIDKNDNFSSMIKNYLQHKNDTFLGFIANTPQYNSYNISSNDEKMLKTHFIYIMNEKLFLSSKIFDDNYKKPTQINLPERMILKSLVIPKYSPDSMDFYEINQVYDYHRYSVVNNKLAKIADRFYDNIEDGEYSLNCKKDWGDCSNYDE